MAFSLGMPFLPTTTSIHPQLPTEDPKMAATKVCKGGEEATINCPREGRFHYLFWVVELFGW